VPACRTSSSSRRYSVGVSLTASPRTSRVAGSSEKSSTAKLGPECSGETPARLASARRRARSSRWSKGLVR
ncbi:MAG: hypothetical protein M3Q49_13920, partial [Actinomycetota bacterium]|nr:hypothetical protein [Actinomycetota bacterium]